MAREDASSSEVDLEAAPLDQLSRHDFASLRGADAKFKWVSACAYTQCAWQGVPVLQLTSPALGEQGIV